MRKVLEWLAAVLAIFAVCGIFAFLFNCFHLLIYPEHWPRAWQGVAWLLVTAGALGLTGGLVYEAIGALNRPKP